MEVEFTPSFIRDLRRVRGTEIRGRVEGLIDDLESAPNLPAISGVARIRGPGRYYRVRIGDYRLGLVLDGGTAVLIRFLHRRDIYRFFP